MITEYRSAIAANPEQWLASTIGCSPTSSDALTSDTKPPSTSFRWGLLTSQAPHWRYWEDSISRCRHLPFVCLTRQLSSSSTLFVDLLSIPVHSQATIADKSKNPLVLLRQRSAFESRVSTRLQYHSNRQSIHSYCTSRFTDWWQTRSTSMDCRDFSDVWTSDLLFLFCFIAIFSYISMLSSHQIWSPSVWLWVRRSFGVNITYWSIFRASISWCSPSSLPYGSNLSTSVSLILSEHLDTQRDTEYNRDCSTITFQSSIHTWLLQADSQIGDRHEARAWNVVTSRFLRRDPMFEWTMLF